MAKPDTSAYKTFQQVNDRLDEIVDLVRDKGISLERSLDLYDEAVAIGSRGVGLVDAVDFTPEEEARLRLESTGPDAGGAEVAKPMPAILDTTQGEDA